MHTGHQFVLAALAWANVAAFGPAAIAADPTSAAQTQEEIARQLKNPVVRGIPSIGTAPATATPGSDFRSNARQPGSGLAARSQVSPSLVGSAGLFGRISERHIENNHIPVRISSTTA